MKIAYFDCFAGISGDMILGALIHLGVPADFLQDNIEGIPLGGFRIHVSPVARMGIHGRKVEVAVDDGGRHSRNYREIRSLLVDSRLPEAVKGLSLKGFDRLAGVEASIHGCSKDDVHFHELGGTDAIVDIVGAALGIDWLGISKVYASEIPVGKGFVDCHHGRLPVPAPATMALLEGVPVYGAGISHELVTPTGAAILTSVCRDFGRMPMTSVVRTGYGAGARDLKEMPNLLRIIVGEQVVEYEADRAVVVEANIDDMNPEIYGFVMERLFEDGALDVGLIPIYMKKNRPGTMLQVICKEVDRGAIISRVLSETTAIGVRHYRVDRAKLAREVKEVNTSYGKVRVKEVSGPGGRVVVPEYEECKRVAREKKAPLKVVYDTIVRDAGGG